MVLQRSLMKKHKMVRLVLKVKYCRVPILYVNSEFTQPPKTVILHPLLLRNTFKLNTNQFKCLFYIFDIVFLLNFQISIIQPEILFDKVDYGVINGWELLSLDFKWPFSLRGKYWGGLVLFVDLLGIDFEDGFPVVEPLLLNFDDTYLRGFLLHGVVLFLWHFLIFDFKL